MDAPDVDTEFLYYFGDLYADFVDFNDAVAAGAAARNLVETRWPGRGAPAQARAGYDGGRARGGGGQGGGGPALGYRGGGLTIGGAGGAAAAAMETMVARRGDDYTDYYDSD